MRKLTILKSAVTILAMVALVATATSAVFTSQARVVGNTFATGRLEIRINGQTSIPGFNVTNAAPCDYKDGKFDVNNYGPPWFAGPSTLYAKTLTMSAVRTSGDLYLYNKLHIIITKDAGGPPEVIWDGPLSGLVNKDALVSYYHPAGLPPGWSETIRYRVTLPCDADNSYQGLSTTFDFVVDATNP